MLDHQLHDAGGDGKVDELLRRKLMYKTVNQCSGEGISGSNGFKAVYGVDGAVIEFPVFSINTHPFTIFRSF